MAESEFEKTTAPLEFEPYVSADTHMAEFTAKALILGIIMAVVLGAANAYLGLRAGMTVAATFPAAVVAMAVLRVFKGTILEENVARTTASVGEALVAGAIFTIPAFLISGVWETLNYWESTGLMLVGGVLGVLFVIVLRRSLVEEAGLPFPESVAAAEIVKAGQGGATGAKYVFGAMGLAALLEFLKNARGLQLFTETKTWFIEFAQSKISLLGVEQTYQGGMQIETPAASPALMGVGYIIGPRLASLTFSGGVFAWLLLIPAILFFNNDLSALLAAGHGWEEIAADVWYYQVRPLAVGAMLVGAFYTLFRLRRPLTSGISKAMEDMKKLKSGTEKPSRLEIDLDFKWIFTAIGVLMIPMAALYTYFSGSLFSGIVATLVMAAAGFFFAAVAGYLVGLIGSSSNPISGLTLSTLLIAALLMVALGTTGTEGIIAVLAVATVVCCAAGVAGDMMQDLKVGQILGGTPWRMEWAELIGVAAASLVLIWPLIILNQGTPGGIGGEILPAPQAGLMALMTQGIVGGDMAWPLVIIGMLFAFGLILVNTPSPMIIAVGMYLPFPTTFAIFAGGMIAWILQWRLEKRDVEEEEREAAINIGTLLASGLVAGEALTGVLLAGLYMLAVELPVISQSPYIGFLVFPLLGWVLIRYPLQSLMGRQIPPTV
ncbi:MAG: oligopeptide transporter, OPT family [bacterium]